MSAMNTVSFDTLKGETITDIEGMVKGSEEITFSTESGRRFRMFHQQDCCEYVSVEDVCGEPSELIGRPILQAEKSSNADDTDVESRTWTFYRITTNLGQVVIRWLGTSNGYYSESVDFEEMK